MNPNNHISSSRRLCFFIFLLCLLSILVGWKTISTKNIFLSFNKLEIIFSTISELEKTSFDDMKDVSFEGLSIFNDVLDKYCKMFKQTCYEESESCATVKKRYSDHLGISPEKMNFVLPSAKLYKSEKVTSNLGRKCDILIFQGPKEEFFTVLSGAKYINVIGSDLYFIFASPDCCYNSYNKPYTFYLLHSRDNGNDWKVSIDPSTIDKASMGSVDSAIKLLKKIDVDIFPEKTIDGENYKFNFAKYFFQLPDKMQKYIVRDLAEPNFQHEKESIQSRFIGETHLNTGILYGSEDIDKAISGAFYRKDQSVTLEFLNIKIDPEYWIPFGPTALVCLSFFLLYHSKRAVQEFNKVNEHWILLDSKGILELTIAFFYAVVLLCTPFLLYLSNLMIWNSTSYRIENVERFGLTDQGIILTRVETQGYNYVFYLGSVLLFVSLLFLLCSVHVVIYNRSKKYNNVIHRFQKLFIFIKLKIFIIAMRFIEKLRLFSK